MPQNGAAAESGGPGGGVVQNGAPPPPDKAAPAAPDYAALYAGAQTELAGLRAQVAKHNKDADDFKKRDERLRALEALEADRTRNPAKHLETLYGKDWHETLPKLKAGTASPETVQAAVSQAEERFQGRLTELEGRLREQIGQVSRLEEERAREDLFRGARAHVEEAKEKYPLLTALGKAGDVGPLIEAHYKSTSRQLPDGTWHQGELWTAEQAAAQLEAHYKDIAEKLRGGPPTGPAEAPRPRLSALPETGAPTINDDSEAARMKRAKAAWDRVQAQKQK